MEIENYIEKIIDDGNIENMHKLSEILDDTMEIIQKYDKDCYKKYEMELYKMAYGENLSREMAEHIVKEMRPYGMKWSLEQTRQIQQQYGIDNVNPVDFYIVLNSAFYGNNRENYRDDYRDYRDYRDYDRRGGRINNRNYRNYREQDYYEEIEMLMEDMREQYRKLEDVSEIAHNQQDKNMIQMLLLLHLLTQHLLHL